MTEKINNIIIYHFPHERQTRVSKISDPTMQKHLQCVLPHATDTLAVISRSQCARNYCRSQSMVILSNWHRSFRAFPTYLFSWSFLWQLLLCIIRCLDRYLGVWETSIVLLTFTLFDSYSSRHLDLVICTVILFCLSTNVGKQPFLGTHIMSAVPVPLWPILF